MGGITILGNEVVKRVNSDYDFIGTKQSTFRKRSGEIRCVVEDDFGKLFIMNPDQLKAPSAKELKAFYKKQIDHNEKMLEFVTRMENINGEISGKD